MASVKELQDLLRSAGLRSTASRLAVLEHFHGHAGQLSHADVCEALGERGFDRATLYRILIDLSEAEILYRSDVGDHVWRFELKAGSHEHSEEHPHFVCVDCGTVSCLPGLTFKVTGAKIPKAVAKNQVALQMKGVCDKCS